MSHFTVLVVTDSPEDLEKTLQPFHEYECTGIKDEYVEWVDEHDKFLEEYETDSRSMLVNEAGEKVSPYDDQFYREPTAEELEKIGPIAGTGCNGEFTYASRDWNDGLGYRPKIRFVPKGYEEKEVPMKEIYSFDEYMTKWNEYGSENIRDSRYGRYTNPNAKWDWYQVGGRWSNILDGKNQVQLKDLNFERMKMQRKANRYANWEEFEKRPQKEQEDKFTREYIHGIKEDITKEEYLKTDEGFYTFAVIKDGEWYERGSMGWWGCVSDEKEDDTWSKEFNKLLNDLPKEKYITVVDCHI